MYFTNGISNSVERNKNQTRYTRRFGLEERERETRVFRGFHFCTEGSSINGNSCSGYISYHFIVFRFIYIYIGGAPRLALSFARPQRTFPLAIYIVPCRYPELVFVQTPPQPHICFVYGVIR